MVVGAAAAVSLLSSPFTAICAFMLGLPVALAASALSRGGQRPMARTVALIAFCVVLGAIPYIAAGLLIPDGNGAGSGSSG
ncbi:MAG: hypothetical protein M3P48_03920 [Actinomycetota bacterium]|nr:hypothetical protein [Actinomycetota bacterium]